MSYFHPYSYSSYSGWQSYTQAGPSNPSHVVEDRTLGSLSSPQFHFETLLHANDNIPISNYSELAGALGLQPVAPPSLGVKTWDIIPQAVNPPRATYAHIAIRTRHRYQAREMARFCKFDGCQKWTTKKDKSLRRHRRTHLRHMLGVKCPSCPLVLSRSTSCGSHLRKCNPKVWEERKKTKTKYNSWGQNVGQEFITARLVEAVYTPLPENEF